VVRLSIVIPAYNEEKRIGLTLWQIDSYLAKQPYDSEIIVVDDGSADYTADYVCSGFPNVRVIAYGRNRGKGYAVKTGMLAASGDYRLFCDADGSTPITDLDLFWPHFDAGADIVIGSRSLPESCVIVRQHPIRENMGRIFNLFVKLLVVGDYIDTQCGFKGFTAKSAELLFARQRLERFSFDAEILYIARKHGLRVAEVPVQWCNSPHSRVGMVADPARMFWDLIHIRLHDLAGRYR
jgi:dolichyl-phosphate beta-glucosyltransferase